MGDNVTTDDGKVASDELDFVNGAPQSDPKPQAQRVKIGFGADGKFDDVNDDNPFPVAGAGELIETLEALRFAMTSLTRTIGFALPNLQGQPIMEVRQATAANLQFTLGSIAGGQTLATVTTVGAVTNQSQMGGFAANDQIPSLMHMQADNLRRNIVVS